MTTLAKSANNDTQGSANSEFNFDGLVIRSMIINGEPWFVASDICKAIKIAAPDVAIRKLDDDEKGQYSIRTLGGQQLMSIISESGLYTLVLRCRDAVKQGTLPYRFRKWVTNEVLPSIRKTGSYQQPVNEVAPTAKIGCRVLHTFNARGEIICAQVARDDEFLTSAQGFNEILRKRGYAAVKVENLIEL